MNPADVVGLRVIVAFGVGNIARLFLALFWLGCLFMTISVLRDDLLHPADFGTDTSNYAAAGERALAGSLYYLAPGDRPVPDQNPPDWSAPILSPPPVATLWAALAPMPALIRFHGLWALGLAATCWLVLYLIARLPVILMVPVMYLSAVNLAVMAWSGNVNALIAPAMALVWLLATSSSVRSAGAWAGLLVGLSALVKLGPAIVGLWLVRQRRWDAVAAAIAAVCVIGIATLLLVGPLEFIEYLRVVQTSAGTPSPWSIPGISRAIGVPGELGALILVLVLGFAAVGILWFRAQPRITFSIAIVGAVLATTVVRPETLVVAVAALVPWISPEAAPTWPARLPSARIVSAAIASVVGTGAVVASVATGGLAASSMTISNLRTEPVVVRFSVPAQGATFGFRVGARSAGVAWGERPGTVTALAFVMSEDCRVLFRIAPGAGTSNIAIRADAVGEGPPVEAPFLAYVPDCAAEVRAELGRAP